MAEGEGESPAPHLLLPCSFCSRTFKPESLEKHLKACERNTLKKRKTFSSLKQRIQGTELAEFFPVTQKKNEKIVKKYESKWKENHLQLVQAVRAARGVEKVSVPLRPSDQEKCPHCERYFGPKAFDRHVEWCKEQKARIPKCPASLLAKARLEARIKYRAPPPVKSKRTLTKEKYACVNHGRNRKGSAENSCSATSLSYLPATLPMESKPATPSASPRGNGSRKIRAKSSVSSLPGPQHGNVQPTRKIPPASSAKRVVTRDQKVIQEKIGKKKEEVSATENLFISWSSTTKLTDKQIVKGVELTQQSRHLVSLAPQPLQKTTRVNVGEGQKISSFTEVVRNSVKTEIKNAEVTKSYIQKQLVKNKSSPDSHDTTANLKQRYCPESRGMTSICETAKGLTNKSRGAVNRVPGEMPKTNNVALSNGGDNIIVSPCRGLPSIGAMTSWKDVAKENKRKNVQENNPTRDLSRPCTLVSAPEIVKACMRDAGEIAKVIASSESREESGIQMNESLDINSLPESRKVQSDLVQIEDDNQLACEKLLSNKPVSSLHEMTESLSSPLVYQTTSRKYLEEKQICSRQASLGKYYGEKLRQPLKSKHMWTGRKGGENAGDVPSPSMDKKHYSVNVSTPQGYKSTPKSKSSGEGIFSESFCDKPKKEIATGEFQVPKIGRSVHIGQHLKPSSLVSDKQINSVQKDSIILPHVSKCEGADLRQSDARGKPSVTCSISNSGESSHIHMHGMFSTCAVASEKKECKWFIDSSDSVGDVSELDENSFQAHHSVKPAENLHDVPIMELYSCEVNNEQISDSEPFSLTCTRSLESGPFSVDSAFGMLQPLEIKNISGIGEQCMQQSIVPDHDCNDPLVEKRGSEIMENYAAARSLGRQEYNTMKYDYVVGEKESSKVAGRQFNRFEKSDTVTSYIMESPQVEQKDTAVVLNCQKHDSRGFVGDEVYLMERTADEQLKGHQIIQGRGGPSDTDCFRQQDRILAGNSRMAVYKKSCSERVSHVNRTQNVNMSEMNYLSERLRELACSVAGFDLDVIPTKLSESEDETSFVQSRTPGKRSSRQADSDLGSCRTTEECLPCNCGVPLKSSTCKCERALNDITNVLDSEASLDGLETNKLCSNMVVPELKGRVYVFSASSFTSRIFKRFQLNYFRKCIFTQRKLAQRVRKPLLREITSRMCLLGEPSRKKILLHDETTLDIGFVACPCCPSFWKRNVFRWNFLPFVKGTNLLRLSVSTDGDACIHSNATIVECGEESPQQTRNLAGNGVIATEMPEVSFSQGFLPNERECTIHSENRLPHFGTLTPVDISGSFDLQSYLCEDALCVSLPSAHHELGNINELPVGRLPFVGSATSCDIISVLEGTSAQDTIRQGDMVVTEEKCLELKVLPETKATASNLLVSKQGEFIWWNKGQEVPLEKEVFHHKDGMSPKTSVSHDGKSGFHKGISQEGRKALKNTCSEEEALLDSEPFEEETLTLWKEVPSESKVYLKEIVSLDRGLTLKNDNRSEGSKVQCPEESSSSKTVCRNKTCAQNGKTLKNKPGGRVALNSELCRLNSSASEEKEEDDCLRPKSFSEKEIEHHITSEYICATQTMKEKVVENSPEDFLMGELYELSTGTKILLEKEKQFEGASSSEASLCEKSVLKRKFNVGNVYHRKGLFDKSTNTEVCSSDKYFFKADLYPEEQQITEQVCKECTSSKSPTTRKTIDDHGSNTEISLGPICIYKHTIAEPISLNSDFHCHISEVDVSKNKIEDYYLGRRPTSVGETEYYSSSEFQNAFLLRKKKKGKKRFGNEFLRNKKNDRGTETKLQLIKEKRCESDTEIEPFKKDVQKRKITVCGVTAKRVIEKSTSTEIHCADEFFFGAVLCCENQMAEESASNMHPSRKLICDHGTNTELSWGSECIYNDGCESSGIEHHPVNHSFSSATEVTIASTKCHHSAEGFCNCNRQKGKFIVKESNASPSLSFPVPLPAGCSELMGGVSDASQTSLSLQRYESNNSEHCLHSADSQDLLKQKPGSPLEHSPQQFHDFSSHFTSGFDFSLEASRLSGRLFGENIKGGAFDGWQCMETFSDSAGKSVTGSAGCYYPRQHETGEIIAGSDCREVCYEGGKNTPMCRLDENKIAIKKKYTDVPLPAECISASQIVRVNRNYHVPDLMTYEFSETSDTSESQQTVLDDDDDDDDDVCSKKVFYTPEEIQQHKMDVLRVKTDSMLEGMMDTRHSGIGSVLRCVAAPGTKIETHSLPSDDDDDDFYCYFDDDYYDDGGGGSSDDNADNDDSEIEIESLNTYSIGDDSSYHGDDCNNHENCEVEVKPFKKRSESIHKKKEELNWHIQCHSGSSTRETAAVSNRLILPEIPKANFETNDKPSTAKGNEASLTKLAEKWLSKENTFKNLKNSRGLTSRSYPGKPAPSKIYHLPPLMARSMKYSGMSGEIYDPYVSAKRQMLELFSQEDCSQLPTQNRNNSAPSPPSADSSCILPVFESSKSAFVPYNSFVNSQLPSESIIPSSLIAEFEDLFISETSQFPDFSVDKIGGEEYCRNIPIDLLSLELHLSNNNLETKRQIRKPSKIRAKMENAALSLQQSVSLMNYENDMKLGTEASTLISCDNFSSPEFTSFSISSPEPHPPSLDTLVDQHHNMPKKVDAGAAELCGRNDDRAIQFGGQCPTDSAYGSLNRHSPHTTEREDEAGADDRLGCLQQSNSESSLPPVCTVEVVQSEDTSSSPTPLLPPSAAANTSPVQPNDRRRRQSKFCHECGFKYPLSDAKFCCECGARRLSV